MKLSGDGIEKGAKGLAILALVIGGGYLAWKGYGLIAGLVKGAGNATQAAGEAIGGATYELINGDANVQTQSKVQQAEAAIAAAGNPPIGSDQWNSIVESYGFAGAPPQ